MLFNSPIFLFAFLPAFLLVYLASPMRWRNLVLFAASIFFYFTTSKELTVILVLSVVANYYVALWIQRNPGPRSRRWLIIGVLINLLPLLYYKYAPFIVQAMNDGLHLLGLTWSIPVPNIPLPIGISFFTFQAVSFIADAYWARIRAPASVVDFGMYHSCFPQLIAGPIVRYEEIEETVRQRIIGLDGLYQGTVRFIVGLAKKCILADNMGVVANHAFGTSPEYLGPALAWVGIVAYTLQIYFDFSGYSDMAIGLGNILGFKYPENFNQPYRSQSVTEFWRRWHMTLSRWFRDYLYIPLGGNRASIARTLVNLFIVFLLCGLWHGAAYTFIVWGILHGSLLVAERLSLRWTGRAPRGAPGWIYTSLAVMVGWVFFRAETLGGAASYLRVLFLGNDATQPLTNLFIILPRDKAVYMALGVLVAIFPFEAIRTERVNRTAYLSLEAAFCTVLFIFSAMQLSVNGFTPFIYFRF